MPAGFPFGTVRRQPVADVAPSASAGAVGGADDAASVARLAYQMMIDAKALPARKVPIVADAVEQLATNAQRTTPMYVRIRAALEKSVGTPYLFVGTDRTQTEQRAAIDRIGNGGQIEFLLYPGQELWACYTGDAASIGDVYISMSTFDEALQQARRTLGR